MIRVVRRRDLRREHRRVGEDRAPHRHGAPGQRDRVDARRIDGVVGGDPPDDLHVHLLHLAVGVAGASPVRVGRAAHRHDEGRVPGLRVVVAPVERVVMREEGTAVLAGPVDVVEVTRRVVHDQGQSRRAVALRLVTLRDVEVVVQGPASCLVREGEGGEVVDADADLARGGHRDRRDDRARARRDRVRLAHGVAGKPRPALDGRVERHLAAVRGRVGVPDAEVDEHEIPVRRHIVSCAGAVDVDVRDGPVDEHVELDETRV